MSEETTTSRCAAAHDEDHTDCVGPLDAVLIRDRQMSRARDAMTEGVPGCIHHGARMLASIEGGRVYPGPGGVDGDAIRVYKEAQTTRPFAWLENAPRTKPSQLSHAENRAAAEERCGRCNRPFDPTDTRWDGQARYAETPFCRSCIDRCHESTDAFHRCPICH